MAVGDLSRPEIVGEVLERLAAGETTRSITVKLAIQREFWRKMAEDKDFQVLVSRAREAGQDALTAETIDIADEATEENVQSAKLRIWARQWYASKLAPKKYGDKMQQQITGADGSPLVISWQAATPSPKLVNATPPTLELDDANGHD